MLVKRLSNIGNSHGILIDKPILELLDITPDTSIRVETDGDVIVLRPLRVRRAELEALADDIMDEHAEAFRELAR